jgi:6,7-dimethyl-8-ribityllumazine synthase
VGEKSSKPQLDASALRLGVVVSRYNEDISRRLLKGAFDTLREAGGEPPEVHWVPGALEIPLTCLQLAESSRFDALLALGCVINGETAHFQFVAGECVRGVMQVQLDTGVPIAFGVLTTYDRDQALARSGQKNNKGSEAAETAVEMARKLRELQEYDEADTQADEE